MIAERRYGFSRIGCAIAVIMIVVAVGVGVALLTGIRDAGVMLAILLPMFVLTAVLANLFLWWQHKKAVRDRELAASDQSHWTVREKLNSRIEIETRDRRVVFLSLFTAPGIGASGNTEKQRFVVSKILTKRINAIDAASWLPERLRSLLMFDINRQHCLSIKYIQSRFDKLSYFHPEYHISVSLLGDLHDSNINLPKLTASRAAVPPFQWFHRDTGVFECVVKK